MISKIHLCQQTGICITRFHDRIKRAIAPSAKVRAIPCYKVRNEGHHVVLLA